MVTYTVKGFTGKLLYSSTFNNVYIKLIGENGESSRTWLVGAGKFIRGSESSFTVDCPESLGRLILVELDKQPVPLFPQDTWFVEKVEVTSPEGGVHTFPIYRWIEDTEVHGYRHGAAVKISEEQNLRAKNSRELELAHRKNEYRWKKYENREGLPYCMIADSASALPAEVQFSFTKEVEFKFTAARGLIRLKLNGLAECPEPWADFDSINRVSCCYQSPVSDFVQKNWKEDSFFGFQFLNGLNPMLIRRCSSLPTNFPVTDDMVSLEGGATLADEMQKGNVFLCDYKLLDGVKTSIINGEKQYLTAPLVLLHKTPDNELKPVAIQLNQAPSQDNPIFLPTDSEYDWLLAKTFVRSAEFNLHELNIHLLRTHLLAEVFTVSLLRNIPRVHPLYKLLVPHTKYTLHINVLARDKLISDDGVFTKYTSSGGEGMFTILQRSLASVTYTSLCLPDDIKDRGLEKVPNHYYREDGCELWDIIHRFVSGVLTHYYKDDQEVQKDHELQNYIKDIFEYGFLSNAESGIPQSFSTVEEIVKFVTMIIFNCSGQHSAVNTGQMDFGAWFPNFPSSMQCPPPSVKNRATEQTLLDTLPDVNATVNILAVLYLLSTPSTDFVSLGQYNQDLFTEAVPVDLIKTFQNELEKLDNDIDTRNTSRKIPYTYLQPKAMENSVAV